MFFSLNEPMSHWALTLFDFEIMNAASFSLIVSLIAYFLLLQTFLIFCLSAPSDSLLTPKARIKFSIRPFKKAFF